MKNINSETLHLKIEDMAFGGKGVARHDGKVYFVQQGVPGDEIEASITHSQKKYSDAIIHSLQTPSPLRSEKPKCNVFGSCGGCDWQNISTQQQLEWKKQFVISSLERIGKIKAPEDIKIIASPKNYFYRNRITLKVKFQSHQKIIAGFFSRGTKNIVSISNCEIAEKPIQEFLQYLNQLSWTPQGDHHLGLDCQTIENGKKIILTIFGDHIKKPSQDILDFLKLLKNFHLTKWAGTILDADKISSFLFETHDDISYHLTPSHFVQVNREMNHQLRKIVSDECLNDEIQTVWDLYAGNGNLSLQLAKKDISVIGCEISPNIKNTNQPKNFQMHHLTTEKFLKKMLQEKSLAPDIIITDPPREGMNESLPLLKNFKTKKLIYVSCDPSCFARDSALLVKQGYELQKIYILDMFPQTFHVETLGVFI